MSFILDALRKSELERQRQSGPSIAELPVAREDRRLPAALLAIGALLAINIAVLAYFMLREEPAPAAAELATVAAAPVAAAPAALPPPAGAAPPPRTLESEFAPAEMPARTMPEPASRAPEAPDPTLLPEPPYPSNAAANPAAPALSTLPPQATAGLAELNVDLHIYAAEPAKRAVFVNGRRYTEGMALAEGPRVEEITRDGVVVNHRGQRFLLPRN